MATQNYTCHNYTLTDFNVIYTTKLVVSSLAVLACIVAISLIVYSKGYKRFVYRLVTYFMATVLCQAISLILEQTPVVYENSLVIVREGWNVPCSIFAFIDQVALWMGNVVVFWIFIYLLYLVWKLYHLKPVQNGNGENLTQKVTNAELAALFATVFVPFTFNWIPFALNMYGLSGLWCWIKMTEKGCYGDQSLGLELMFTMFYGPLIFLMLFGIVSLLVIVVALCRQWMRVDGLLRRQYMRGIKEIALVMIYPILYNVICMLQLVNRIDSAVRTNNGEEPFYPLWLAHALADSFRTFLPPLAFLLHPSTWKNLVCVQKKEEDTEYFYVPPEDSDIDEGIMIRGTKQTHYESILQ